MLAWFNDMGLGIMGALDPLIFLSALLGVSVGAVIGIIPGLGPAVVISLAIPLTFGMGPLFAIALFLGIYKGGTYGKTDAEAAASPPSSSTRRVRPQRPPPSSTATHWRNRGRRERPSPPRCMPRYSGTPSGS